MSECRANYAAIALGSTALIMFRNPLGAASLATLAAGSLLYVDAFAKKASAWVMALVQKVDPQRAVAIRGKPGGHDGCRCARLNRIGITAERTRTAAQHDHALQACNDLMQGSTTGQ